MNMNIPSVDQTDRHVPINLRQSGPTSVEMLVDTRVRKSPYWHLSMEAGCWRASVYNRMYHPRGYVRPEDGGTMVEYEALVNHVTLWNVAVERQIQVKGPDAEAFVNFVITRDATKIPVMRARYVILCNETGASSMTRYCCASLKMSSGFPSRIRILNSGCGASMWDADSTSTSKRSMSRRSKSKDRSQSL